MNRSLNSTEYRYLRWDNENNDVNSSFPYPNLVRIRTETDGSCFFHAVIKAYFKPYIRGKMNGQALDRKKFVRKLRRDLALKLGQRVKPQDSNSTTYYETLSEGDLPEISKSIPDYTLKNLQKLLDSSKPVDNIFNEFVSNELDKDIYILDLNKKDVYMTGTDLSILYKDRDSIVIIYMPGHYELVGLETNADQTYTNRSNKYIQTLFKYDHPLIQSIRQRQLQLISQN